MLQGFVHLLSLPYCKESNKEKSRKNNASRLKPTLTHMNFAFIFLTTLCLPLPNNITKHSLMKKRHYSEGS
jgi:hypothetical protein